MSTFMANKGNIERKWYILDAAGKPLGKTDRKSTRLNSSHLARSRMPSSA